MNRMRSMRPRKSSAVQELERLVRNLGAPSTEALAAARETLAEPASRIALTEPAIAEFVEQAAEICLSAYRSWDQCNPQSRVHLRGFSLDLLAMIADQVIRLERAFRDYKQCELEVMQAAERAAALRERNGALVAQARAVLQMVGGAAILPPASGEEAATGALTELADLTRKLLQQGSAVVQSRCQLYQLDSEYAQALLVAANEQAAAEHRAADSSSVLAKQHDVERLLDWLKPLLEHVSQVFELASHFAAGISPVAKLTAGSPKAAGAKPIPKAAPLPTVAVAGRAHAAHDPRRVQRLAIPQEVNVRAKR
jgi:hypothetical protein